MRLTFDRCLYILSKGLLYTTDVVLSFQYDTVSSYRVDIYAECLTSTLSIQNHQDQLESMA